MKIRFLFSLLIVSVIAAPSYSTVDAAGQYGQYGQYGGYQSVTPGLGIIIDKKVAKGTTTKGGQVQYVDNFSPNNPRFVPTEKVYFQLKVKNTSSTTLNNIVVKDFLPGYVEPIEGPGGYDAKTRTVSYTIDKLEPGEEKVNNIAVQVLPQDKLPADKGMMCIVNKAQASKDNVGDEDSAQFCIEKQVIGVQQVPSAGPELGLTMFASSLATLASGLLLKRKV